MNKTENPAPTEEIDGENAVENSETEAPRLATPKLAATQVEFAQLETPQVEAALIPATAKNSAKTDAIAQNDAEVERQIRRMSRRSFLSGAVAIGFGLGGWKWLNTRRAADGIPWPLRQNLENNGQLAQDFFSSTRLAPTFLKTQISDERTNGDIGLGDDFDVSAWQLNVKGLASGEDLALSLADIKKLPRVEMTTEMKCIEGWSIIVNWAGARFSDFAQKYPPATQSGDAPNIKSKPDDLAPYVGLTTPDGVYYVGMDMPSALHPQTLLCYEMNGKALTAEHGAPLRLVTPVKYGIKHIKRIGQIEYSNKRPADYWAEQGYDWYAGH